MSHCEPYVRVGGYDDPLVFACDEHKTATQLVGPDGTPAHSVTLDMFLEAYYHHRKGVVSTPVMYEPALCQPRFPILVPHDTEEGKMFTVGSYTFVAGEFLREGSVFRLDKATGRVVKA